MIQDYKKEPCIINFFKADYTASCYHPPRFHNCLKGHCCQSSVLWGYYGVGEGGEFSVAVPCGGTGISCALLSWNPRRYVSHFQARFRRSEPVSLAKHTSRAEVQSCIAVTSSSAKIRCMTVQNIEEFIHCNFSVEKYVDGPLRYSYGSVGN